MKTNIRQINRVSLAGVASLVFIISAFARVPFAHATGSTMGAPAQSDCNNGSTPFTWNNQGITPPTISSMTVGGETVADPTNPDVGSLGASICPNVELGRRTGLYVYKATGGGNDMDLTGAVTPDTQTVIDAETPITITIDPGDMGELAPYFSFALVHGIVSNYETSGLGTSNASMTITFSPTRTPFGSNVDENDHEFDYCTATPPNCSANASQADAFSASMDITFDQTGYGDDFAGSYFAMTGAMGAWAEAVGPGGQPRSLRASLGGPHFLADGATPNVGSLQAFIPDAVIENLFETTADALSGETLSVTRTEGDETTDAPFDLTVVDGGVIVSMDSVTFSSPSYNIGLIGFNDFGGGGQEDSDNSMTRTNSAGKMFNLQTPNGTTITSLTSSSEGGLTVSDAGYEYSLGLDSFTLTVPDDSPQQIVLSYVTDLKPSQVVARKYNATTHAYSTIPGAVFTEDQNDGEHLLMLTYSISDGGALDQDGVVNGTIVDPVGVGVASVATPNTGLGANSPWKVHDLFDLL